MKKAICVLAALVLCVGLFTACGGKDKNSSSAQKPSSSSAVSSGSLGGAGGSSSMLDSGMTGGEESLPGESGMAGDGVDNGMDSADGAQSGTIGESGGAAAQNNEGASVAANAATEALWQLRVVSAASPLPEGFTVETRAIKGYDERLFDVRAADALEAMLTAAESDGCKLYLVSAYRSVARQKALFTRKTNYYTARGYAPDAAGEEAAKWVARPGTSEHNVGLAADIVSANWYVEHSDLTQDFDTTPAYAWLTQNAAHYGFVLRYPQGKESVTGVVYEPWHYRYVGVYHAQAMQADGLTLEEYTAQRAA